MRKRFQKFGSYSSLSFCSVALPLILLLQLSLPGVALCLEQDGNVELETYTNGTCYEKNSGPATFLQSSSATSTEHCGTCIDIPTTDKNSEHKALSSNDLTAEIDIHAFAAYQLTAELSPEIKRQSFILEDFPVYTSFLDSIRITVINC